MRKREEREKQEMYRGYSFPHFRDGRFAMVDGSSESDFGVFELAEQFQDVRAHDTYGAQSMEDGSKQSKSKGP